MCREVRWVNEQVHKQVIEQVCKHGVIKFWAFWYLSDGVTLSGLCTAANTPTLSAVLLLTGISKTRNTRKKFSGKEDKTNFEHPFFPDLYLYSVAD
mgnify:CR=1 FL=1